MTLEEEEQENKNGIFINILSVILVLLNQFYSIRYIHKYLYICMYVCKKRGSTIILS